MTELKQRGGIYRSQPIAIRDDIPIYSDMKDRYVMNYQKIAADHLLAMTPNVENPFIDTDLWRQLEDSTRVLLEKYSTPGMSVLDVGVGLGRIVGPMKSLNRYGIDISLDYLKKAREQGIEAVFSRIEEMPYHDDVFDVVLACDVLEHVIDLHACCKQILRVLKPNGIAIIRVPYRDDLDAYLDESIPYEYVHLRAFDVAALRLQFQKIFDCEYLEHTFVAPYLKGAPRMKLRQLKSDSSVMRLLATIPEQFHPLSLLKRATAVTEEEFINWIYDLRKNAPEIFNSIADELVYSLEVNIVFRKRRDSAQEAT